MGLGQGGQAIWNGLKSGGNAVAAAFDRGGRAVANGANYVGNAIGTFFGKAGQAVGGRFGFNRKFRIRFEILVAAHDNAEHNGTEFEYIPVPYGTNVVLAGLAIFSSTIKDNGIAIFENIPRWPSLLYHARLTNMGRLYSNQTSGVEVYPPTIWDTMIRNLYQCLVHSVNRDVPGIFTVNRIADFSDNHDDPPTFQVDGFPVHATLTYSLKNQPAVFRSDPVFAKDPEQRETVEKVPVPAGILVSLVWNPPSSPHLPQDYQVLVAGRTVKNGRWDAVLYNTPYRRPPGFPVWIKATMNLEDDDLALGPINVHSSLSPPPPNQEDGPPVIDNLSPLISVITASTWVTLLSGEQSPMSLGTVEDRVNFEIKEDTYSTEPHIPYIGQTGPTAVFVLQAIADVHSWFRALSMNYIEKGPGFRGFQVEVFLMVAPKHIPTSCAIPWQVTDPAMLHSTLIYEMAQYTEHTIIAHEYFHMIEYKLGLMIPPSDLKDEKYHSFNMTSNYRQALNEGWATFVEKVFGNNNSSCYGLLHDYYEITDTIDIIWESPDNTKKKWHNLWDNPGAGEKIEGCVANALWEIYSFNPNIMINPICSLPPSLDVTYYGLAKNAQKRYNHLLDGNLECDDIHCEFPFDRIWVQVSLGSPDQIINISTDDNGRFSFSTTRDRSFKVDFKFMTYRFNPVAAVFDSTHGVAFDDKYPGPPPLVKEPNDTVLDGVAVQFNVSGSLQQSETDQNGLYARPSTATHDDIWRSDTYPFPCVIPAALTRTGNQDQSQASLWHINKVYYVYHPASGTPVVEEYSHGYFRKLFYECWPQTEFSSDEEVRQIYIRMLENVRAIDTNNYDMVRFIQKIFWNNNMLLPQIVRDSSAYPMSRFYLRDVLGEKVQGSFEVRTDSTNPSSPLYQHTLENGDFFINTLLFPVQWVEFNIRHIVPRLKANAQDVWLHLDVNV